MTVQPAFGLAHVVPDDAIAAWGARLIVTQDGTVDLPPDRQGSDGGPHSSEVLALLQERYRLPVLLDTIRDLLREGTMLTREAEDFILYLDDRLVVHANTNASAGYCYVTAWLYEPTITLSLEIDNQYELYEDVTTHKTVTVPLPPEDTEDRDEWEWDHIFEATGVGHEDGNSWYFVEVTASSNTDLVPVGTKYEFGL